MPEECLTNDIVTEGAVFSKNTEVNIDKLTDHVSLIVIAKDVKSANYVNWMGYLKKYKFRSRVIVNFNTIMHYEELVSNWPAQIVNRDIDDIPKSLCTRLLNIKVNDQIVKRFGHKEGFNNYLKRFLRACDEYSKRNKSLVMIMIDDPHVYSNPIVREYPVVIRDPSKLANILTGNKNVYDQFQILSDKIPKECFRRDLKYPLYHLSTSPNLRALVPMVTSKPLKTENAMIPRISCSPDIVKCLVALDAFPRVKNTGETLEYYIYKLNIDSNTRIVVPSQRMVPDRNLTDEHWVLDTVSVTLDGKIKLYYQKIKLNYGTYEAMCKRWVMETTESKSPDDVIVDYIRDE